MHLAKREASSVWRGAVSVRRVAAGAATDLGRRAITCLPWPLWADALALLMGATFQRPAKPGSMVVIQAAYEIYLI
jgi:hypothetical protein